MPPASSRSLHERRVSASNMAPPGLQHGGSSADLSSLHSPSGAHGTDATPTDAAHVHFPLRRPSSLQTPGLPHPAALSIQSASASPRTGTPLSSRISGPGASTAPASPGAHGSAQASAQAALRRVSGSAAGAPSKLSARTLATGTPADELEAEGAGSDSSEDACFATLSSGLGPSHGAVRYAASAAVAAEQPGQHTTTATSSAQTSPGRGAPATRTLAERDHPAGRAQRDLPTSPQLASPSALHEGSTQPPSLLSPRACRAEVGVPSPSARAWHTTGGAASTAAAGPLFGSDGSAPSRGRGAEALPSPRSGDTASAAAASGTWAASAPPAAAASSSQPAAAELLAQRAQLLAELQVFVGEEGLAMG
jgi:hypothetical protein